MRELRPIQAEELEAFTHQLSRAFQGRPASAEWLDRSRRLRELDRSLAVFDDGELVATAGIYSFELSVPGGLQPMAGVTAVSVLPTHRRQGLLTALMRRQLDDIHERGEPLAGLLASEAPIYGRFGYGLATYSASFTVARARTAFARPFADPGRILLAAPGQARAEAPRVWEAVRLSQPGMLNRTAAMWDVQFEDSEATRDRLGEQQVALHQEAGRCDGFAVFRQKVDWDFDASNLRIEQLLAASPAAYAALWRFLFSIDLMGRFEALDRPPAEPLAHLLADPRAVRPSVTDGTWIRLVDVPAALGGRRYPVSGSLVLAVEDDFCAWNRGVYELVGGPDGAECRPSARPPELELSAAELGAAYLGGTSLRLLAGAGRVRERASGALDRADAMFSWPVPAWNPSHF